MKITITRALAKLTSLKKEVKKDILTYTPTAVQHGKILRSPHSAITREVFEDKAKSGFQSLQDKLSLIEKLNKAILISNATTEIEIAGVVMTVEQALLVKRQVIPLKEDMLSRYKSVWTETRRSYEAALSENEAKVERMIRDAGDNDQKKSRIDAETYVNQSKAVDIVDPLKLPDVIESLEKEINDFNLNVDYALSESNSTTFIEID